MIYLFPHFLGPSSSDPSLSLYYQHQGPLLKILVTLFVLQDVHLGPDPVRQDRVGQRLGPHHLCPDHQGPQVFVILYMCV